MIDDIKEKLKSNPKCNLSRKELEVLYEINDNYFNLLEKYRNVRDIYSDFSKLLGSKYVANKINDIGENTICYIGNLDISVLNFLELYNLRYLYGDLECSNPYEYNLENLEIIYGSVSVESLNGLENLEKILHTSTLLLYSSELKNIEIPFANYTYLYKTKYIENVVFKDEVKYIDIPEVKNIKNVIFPNSLKYLYLDMLISLDYLKLPDSIEFLSLNSIEKFDNYILPSNLYSLSIRSLKNSNGLILPNNLDRLVLNDLKCISGLEIPSNLEVYIQDEGKEFYLVSKDELRKAKVLIKK